MSLRAAARPSGPASTMGGMSPKHLQIAICSRAEQVAPPRAHHYEPEWEEVQLWKEQEREQFADAVFELAEDYGFEAPPALIERLGHSLYESGDAQPEADFDEEGLAGVFISMTPTARQRVLAVLSLWAQRVRHAVVPLARLSRPVFFRPRPRQHRSRRTRRAGARAGPSRRSDNDPLPPSSLSAARLGGYLDLRRGLA